MSTGGDAYRHKPWHHRVRRALGHSIKLRLVMVFMLLALAMAFTFVGGAQRALSIGWRDAARPLVMDYVDHLAADIAGVNGSLPSVPAAQAIARRLPLTVSISGPQVNWRSKPAQAYDNWGGDQHGVDEKWQNLLKRSTADGHTIEFGINGEAFERRSRLVGYTLVGMLLLTVLAYLYVRRLLRPLDDISAGARRFGVGDFTQPIAIKHPHKPDELGQLATTINTMGANIQQMLEAKRSLLLAISHELRSPLTRARLNTELLPETAEVLPSRDALLRDLALMRDLVTDLLESERLSNPHAALHREPVDLALLVAEVVHGLPGNPQVQTDISSVLPRLALDPTRIRLLLRNLLDNALRHSADAIYPPVISVRPFGNGVQITVCDSGPGVAPDQLPQLGQPFYRPDAARTREGGGVGLGLYLCRLVVQAHGGSFMVRNTHPGLEACVNLPELAPTAAT